MSGPIRCIGTLPAAGLALLWMFCVFSMVIATASAIAVGLHHVDPAYLNGGGDIVHFAIGSIIAFLVGALTFRAFVFLPSDLSRLVRRFAGETDMSGLLSEGRVRNVDYEIRFNRAFRDYWPFPYHVTRTVCGRRQQVRAGGARDMVRSGRIVVRATASEPGNENVLLCSGSPLTGQCSNLATRANELFGADSEDWEICFDITTRKWTLCVPCGSWAGSAFADRFLDVVEFVKSVAANESTRS